MMHIGLGNAMLFGMVILLVLTLITEALTGDHLRAATESGIHAQRTIESVMQNAEAVEAMDADCHAQLLACRTKSIDG